MSIEATERQEILDEEHLRLLSIGFVVSGAMNAFFSLFGLFYMFMGIMVTIILRHVPVPAGQPGPDIMGWFFVAIGFGVFAVMITITLLKLLAARQIGRRRSRTTCMVAAALSCLELPYGTALGVGALIVLSRPSVAARFDAA